MTREVARLADARVLRIIEDKIAPKLKWMSIPIPKRAVAVFSEWIVAKPFDLSDSIIDKSLSNQQDEGVDFRHPFLGNIDVKGSDRAEDLSYICDNFNVIVNEWLFLNSKTDVYVQAFTNSTEHGVVIVPGYVEKQKYRDQFKRYEDRNGKITYRFPCSQLSPAREFFAGYDDDVEYIIV